jgi:hypothetical protein
MTKFHALLAMFFIMVVLDVATTHLALSLGAVEISPIWRFLLQGGPALHLLLKLIIASLAILVVMRLVPLRMRLNILLMLTIGMECVVAWNCGVIALL